MNNQSLLKKANAKVRKIEKEDNRLLKPMFITLFAVSFLGVIFL